MSKVMERVNKILPHVMKFVNCKAISAIKDGFIVAMPLTIIGSLFLLLAFLPIPGYGDFMSKIFGDGWMDPLFQVVGSTFDILALVGTFGIANAYVQKEGINGSMNAGVLGIVSLLILINSFIETADGSKIGGVIPKAYLGGKGMIAAILVGLAVGYLYSFIIKKNWTIKMPESVPSGVANAFTALIPGLIIVTIAFLVYIFFNSSLEKTLIEVIYDVIQVPLQGMTDSFWGAILIPVLISLLWWCGIHGSAIVMGIMGPILQSNGLYNQQLFNEGTKLVAGDNARIVTNQFIDQYITVGGAGLTLGLVVSMVLFSKSTQFKQLGKLSLIPGLFNINEPVIFAAPIVFNPFMFLPFILAPFCSAILVYGSIKFGIVDPFRAISVPWTTPIVLSGFLIGGIKAALLQIVIFAMTVGIYLPFFKYQDKLAYQEETGIIEDKKQLKTKTI